MSLSLTEHPPWRQLLIISVGLPALIGLAMLSFAWPAARLAPRHLPVGIVSASPAAGRAAVAIRQATPGGFDLKAYPNPAAARRAIEDRDVYGALVVSTSHLTVMAASAASPTVAQLLTGLGSQLARQAGVSFHQVDVVPSSAQDPRGLVLSSVLLPLSICSVIMAAVIAVLLDFKPARRQLVALVTVSAAAGLGVNLIAQGFLGALPHQPVATWAAVSLTMLAMSAGIAGLVALFGPKGLGLGAVMMVFIGNPFSGVSSAPELLPSAVGRIGQWLPPGAGANLLRNTVYFGGNGASSHLVVLAAWSVLGMLAVVVGHHTLLGHAYRHGGTDVEPEAGQSAPLPREPKAQESVRSAAS